MYGPGAQADEVLVFNTDGNGRLDVINFGLCAAYEFRWHVSSPNELTFIGTKTLSLSDDCKTVIEVDERLNVNRAAYRISEEKTPSGRTLRVLRVKLKDLISDHFGFVSADTTGFEAPDFQLS